MDRVALSDFIKRLVKVGDLVSGLTIADPAYENPVVAMYQVERHQRGEVPDYFLAAAETIRLIIIEGRAR